MEKLLKINKNLKFGYADLMEVIDPDHKFTLRDVLKACVSSKIPMDILKSILQCDYIEDYWKELNSKKFKNDGEIEYLQLSWISSIDEFEGVVGSGHAWDFSGIGKEGDIPQDLIDNCPKKEIERMKRENYTQSYAIEFTPVYELAGLPIKITNSINIEDWRGVNEAKNKTKFYNNMNTKLDVQPSITLIEVLYWIFWELSFVGSPERRDEQINILNERVDKFKQAEKDGTLGEITIPWEDVKKKLKDKYLNKEI